MTNEHEPEHETAAVGEAVLGSARTVAAPPRLRARLAEQRVRATERRPRRRWAVLAVPAAVAALAVVAIGVVGLADGGTAAPSVHDAAALALARPTGPPPAVAADGVSVRAQVGGVKFPNYAYTWPRWRAAGIRHDRVHGRAVTTVVYRGPAGDVGYTIVDGAPLDWPRGARRVVMGGLRLSVLRHGGATVVTWRRAGRTCVLAARRASAAQLARFAAWA